MRTLRYFRYLALALVAAALLGLCWPRPDPLRARVTAEIARRLSTRPELVEVERLEARGSGGAVAFEGIACVSESQPGDLHAERYRVSGTSAAEGEYSRLQQMSLVRLSNVPPEPRP